jgi:hypothetical protein
MRARILCGKLPYNALNLTKGVRFPFYALENRNIRKAAVAIQVAGSVTFDHYWEDGPELTGWGDPIAKYPDGTPAIAQGIVGHGWVVLSGVHPEAPDSWRKGLTFSTPAQNGQCLCCDPYWRCAEPEAARALLKTPTVNIPRQSRGL